MTEAYIVDAIRTPIGNFGGTLSAIRTDDLGALVLKELIKRKINYKILEVPGAFEIPVLIAKNINKFDGFIAVGSIIKGKTPNFTFISSAITNGLIQLSILNKKSFTSN
jgi:6,7-dimethyl-8-ribityllumazine synthase